LTSSGGHSQCVDESVSICTGAFFLAEAGVLDGKRDDALASLFGTFEIVFLRSKWKRIEPVPKI
jgi:hypothetical protein